MNKQGITGHIKQIKNLETLLNKKKLPGALLFSGPSGIGKKIIAKRFLSSLYCEKENPPCLSCRICGQISSGTHPDFIEIAPNERGIIPIGGEEKQEPGTVRWLIDRLSKKSLYGRTGIILDGVDRITEEGQNALLKTIEEPSLEACFVLISSNRAKILPTILSRCLEIKFSPLSDKEIRQLLGTESAKGAESDLITGMAGGSMETAAILSEGSALDDILSILREIASFAKSSSAFNGDISALQKKTGFVKLLDIIINFYRLNLLSNIKKNNGIYTVFKDIFIGDSQFIINLIKIFLALKKSESQNINTRYALKGMLYSLSAEMAAEGPSRETAGDSAADAIQM